MQRWFRLSSLLLALITALTVAHGQGYVEVRGSLPPNDIRIFVKDTIYRISGTYTIGGTLVIEPGTRVEFLPNGRLVDSTGGRIIADGRASATYNANAANALAPPYSGYADPAYFRASGVVTSTIYNEPTINPTKYNEVFLVNIGSNPYLQNMTPAMAVMYAASRLHLGGLIPAINNLPWFRETVKTPATPINVRPERITFIAGDVNNFSREWGHIVVLPGARAAFFRDVDFLNFRKDTTVDKEPYYLQNSTGNILTHEQAETANDALLRLANGSGGAITTFSVRTWVVGCNFRNNMARYNGGALQILQAPRDQYAGTNLQLWPQLTQSQIDALPKYNATTNPFITDPWTASPIDQQLTAIDLLHLSAPEPLTNVNRQSLDDARLAVYLGRIRQNRFSGNRALLSNVEEVRVGPVRFVTDVDKAATVFGNITRSQKNTAHGGAIYIAGRTHMVVGLGINDFQGKDTLECLDNYALNRQPSTPVGNQVTRGAKGGAIYIGDSTGVILAGRFTGNSTSVPYITSLSTANLATSSATYSQGGAVYAASSAEQLEIRGNLDNNPPTHFINNQSGRGGAVYVEANHDGAITPHVGGSDGIIVARNYGFNIKFRNNKATASGGAIHTGNNMYIYGAGGVSGPLWVYGTNYGVELTGNTAGFYGGGVAVDLAPGLKVERRALRFVRAHFLNNKVGDITNDRADVRGGGGLYTLNADLNLVKAVEFRGNTAYNGNGGGIAVVTPDTLARRRFMLTDLDNVSFAPNGVVLGYTPNMDVFTYSTNSTNAPRPDERMLTRFYDNVAYPNMQRMGNGVTQIGSAQTTHPGTNLRENGTGLGGAIYIADSIRIRVDTFGFDRVRFQGNSAYSGAAIYSDNYDLKLAMLRCLVTNNTATSEIGRHSDTISGPMVATDNPASSDLAGAILYGEMVGPLPWSTYSWAANSIYDNDARFIIRLPDAQDTKGVLAGTTGLGFGGVDTLRGNYWGRTEANVNTILPLSNNNTFNRTQETFFIAGNGETHLQFVRGGTGTQQGPFESEYRIHYQPIPIWTIPDTLLMAGRIYDIFDKGTDIKTADYGKRRMSPIEDFAVGIPPVLKRYTDPTQPSYNKYVKRMTRCPYDADKYPFIAAVQTEFVGDHPIGYPVFLEARADYDQTAEISNNDPRGVNESVFFVINERTGDYIRINMRQRGVTDSVFRAARVELVPDSTNGDDPNYRRANEGLASFGVGAVLLNILRHNPVAEDSSALQGRVWDGSTALGQLGGANFRLANRPTLPTSNNGKETYYGGERFRALPVRNGDNVSVVSRTVLWKEGVSAALDGALTFTVNNQTEPPLYTGSGDTLRNSPYIHPEMRNRVFVTENRLYTPITSRNSPRPGGGSWFNEPEFYPADSANRPIGNRYESPDIYERDSIFATTAVDINKFYDPRVILDPTFGSELSYFWSIVDQGSALRYWLRDTLVKKSDANSTSWEARGFRFFRGRPINPYIVPGGETVEVVAKNFPPSLEVVDSLRAAGIGQDTISKWLYLYPSYFHAQKYDNNALPLDQRDPTNTNARYLQQDTVNFGWLDTNAYRFRIHVVDSLPRFLWVHKTGLAGPQYTRMQTGNSTIVLDPTTTDTNTYQAGIFRDTLYMPVTESRVGRKLQPLNAIVREVYNDPNLAPLPVQNDTLDVHFVANLTDSLRFRLDVNTDDEFEDAAAVDGSRYVVQQYGPWDFKYGKTAYGYQSIAIRNSPADTTLDEVVMARPQWMSNTFMRKYADPATPDVFAEDFTSAGKIDIRIDGNQARQLLRPTNFDNGGNPWHDDLNTDSLVSIVVNDGHGGINTLTRRVFVNVQPKIVTTNLEDAIEDLDYNIELLDSSRRIKVFDPNWGQSHTFELIYQDDQRDSIAIDPYFHEAGFIVLDSTRKTTPKWLKINDVSGLLYGTARVTDLPFEDTTVQVTVLVRDAGYLSDITTIDLRVQAVNHRPDLFSSPILKCVDLGKAYEDTVYVTDLDLKRKQADNEQLSFEVLEPLSSTWTFTPSTLSSPVADTQKVVISTTALNGTPVNGRITIKIRVTDSHGAADTLVYNVAVSDETRFTANVKVRNNLGAFQNLVFGLGGANPATRGDEDGSFGQLDSNYCEYELPPVPYIDVFDARWTVPNRNGILRNIFPFSSTPGEAVYRARFQAGGETGSSSAYFPVTISWCRDEIPATDATNPGSYWIRDDISNGALFNFNMKTGEGRSAADILHKEGQCDTLVISRTSIGGFIIVYDYTTGVETDDMTISNILTVTSAKPNPFVSETSISFNVPVASHLTVEVFDAVGSHVATLANQMFTAGQHSIDWDGTASGAAVANGMYTVRISDGTKSATYQVVIMR
ncbi:MAG: T9SS C-terminal target domain-containing protein [Chlorobi bacterium]|nr:T9SS C-terminal target domain-containing protein [Chlorobiota bacterium]NOG67349.1 T9SS type A sorting domain-containing protein [Chlorobiota bacterium]QOJ26176.1 MAG: T9SS type A sorting domain-containing protein [Ignavibacteria bacterium]